MKKWQLIDLVRSFSIVVVMAVHLNHFLIMPDNPFWDKIWDHLQRKGTDGVFLFFIVSGFLITHVIANNPGGLIKPDMRRFYIQRAGRILPLFLLTVLLGTLLLLFKDHTRELLFFYGADYENPLFWISLSAFSFNWCLVHERAFDIYGIHWLVLWSLSIEEQFYFIFPAALKKMGSKKRLVLFLILIIAMAFLFRLCSYFCDPGNQRLQQVIPFAVFDLIASGVLTYLVFERYEMFLVGHKRISSLIFILGFILLVVTYWTSFPGYAERIVGNNSLELGMAGVLLGGIHLPIFDSKYLKLFSFPGKHCYCNYLIHPTILYLIYPLLHPLNTFLALALYVAMTTGVSAVSYHFFEMPANRWIRKNFV
jgi:peptidoglycan/LPS O-acetylase OafA/YrhL